MADLPTSTDNSLVSWLLSTAALSSLILAIKYLFGLNQSMKDQREKELKDALEKQEKEFLAEQQKLESKIASLEGKVETLTKQVTELLQVNAEQKVELRVANEKLAIYAAKQNRKSVPPGSRPAQ